MHFCDRISHASICLVVLSVLLLGSCVRVEETPEPLTKTNLFVTKSSEGVHISWRGESGLSYTLMYLEPGKQKKWQPFSGAINLTGGQEYQFKDRSPRAKLRRYRLHVVPLKTIQ